MKLKYFNIFILFFVAPLFVFSSCLIPEDSATLVNKTNLASCLKMAEFVNPNELTQNHEKLEKWGLIDNQTIFCRYNYQKQNGKSTKFRCALTNNLNQLYNSKGQVIPEAVKLITEDSDVYLADTNGEKLKIENNKAFILKVRYTPGLADRRNVENYTSVAASKILARLEIPTHHNVMTEKVTCFGCDKNPFIQKKLSKASHDFLFASLEFKFEGKRIYSPDQGPWSWADLNKIKADDKTSDEIKIQIDQLALSSHLLGYIADSAIQNSVVCTDIDKKSDPHQCNQVIAMTHDIGASFGNRNYRSQNAANSRPRGDLEAYEVTKIFKDNTCEFMYQSSNKSTPITVSKKARDEFIARASKLTQFELENIFRTSQISRLYVKDLESKDSVKFLETDKRWAQAVLSKIEEIKNAHCVD